jgi:polyhydroxybutyrate depolymerase
MKHLILTTIVAAGLLTTGLLSGCGSDTDTNGDSSELADAGSQDGASTNEDASGGDASGSDASGRDTSGSDTSLAPPWDDSEPLGGDRPAETLLPDDYDTSRTWPIVFLLHGYSASASVQNAYFGLGRLRHRRGFIAVLPDGTKDSSGNRFWNATDACCNFANAPVDDVAYLSGLLSEAKERLAIDTERVYFMGHSNGGFMSYRMACELGSEISAIASLAGSSFDDPADCTEDGQVGVLQIHGDADGTVSYTGGAFVGSAYPGAQEVAERWAARNGCDAEPESGETFNAASDVSGDETEVQQWTNCDPSTSVELWTIRGGGHIPGLDGDFTGRVLDFLWTHD